MFNHNLIRDSTPNHYGKQECNWGMAVHSVVPLFSTEELEGTGSSQEEAELTGVLHFSPALAPWCRGWGFWTSNYEFFCSSLEMQLLLDFYACDLTLLSERQKPHHHRDFTLPTALFYYKWEKILEGQERVWRIIKNYLSKRRKSLKSQSSPSLPKGSVTPIRM